MQHIKIFTYQRKRGGGVVEGYEKCMLRVFMCFNIYIKGKTTKTTWSNMQTNKEKFPCV